HRLLEGPCHPLHARVTPSLIDLDERHREAGASADLDDARSHDAAPDHTDLRDVLGIHLRASVSSRWRSADLAPARATAYRALRTGRKVPPLRDARLLHRREDRAVDAARLRLGGLRHRGR